MVQKSIIKIQKGKVNYCYEIYFQLYWKGTINYSISGCKYITQNIPEVALIKGGGKIQSRQGKHI